MRLISRWHAFASRRALILNAVLLFFGVTAAVDLASLEVDPEWLGLFDRNDPQLLHFLTTGTADANMYAVYVRVPFSKQDRAEEVAAALRAHENVSGVRSESPVAGGEGKTWLFVSISSDPPLSVPRRREVIDDLRGALREYGLHNAITGPEVVMSKFSGLVARDLLRSSLLAAALVGAVVVLFVDASGMVFVGLVYEAVGFLFALAIFRRLFGSINIIASAVPGILLGLGIDFVIHTVLAFGREEAGLRAYATVRRPMSWGVATTATAFVAIAVAGPRGLVQVGALGTIGVLSMFAVVFFFLPPTLTRLSRGGRFHHGPRPLLLRSHKMMSRFPTGRRAVLIARCAIISLTIALTAFLWQVKWDPQLSTNYYPNLHESALMDELAGDLGVYPTLLHLTVWTDDSAGLAPMALTLREMFVLLPDTLMTRYDGETDLQMTSVGLLPIKDPFDSENLADLREWLEKHLSAFGRFILTGEAVLTEHLSSLIKTSMLRAYGIMVFALIIALTVMFRRFRFIAGPVFVLLLATSCTLGALAIWGSAINAFSITIFPLLMGIGVDDCLYLADAINRKILLRKDTRLLKALAMTTTTTVAGYSSLMVAANKGIVDMGRTAVLGLILVFLCTLFLLPPLLRSGSSREKI